MTKENIRTFTICVAAATALLIASPTAPLAAQSGDAPARTITWGGFVDTYFAYDFGRPATIDRGYTTQAARANEFNVNLAFVEAVLSGDRLRGRLALQAGTSVQSNYAGEPAVGAWSGPSLARHIQEAYVGVQASSALWVDAGIFYSNVGGESWASADNLVYTRSLIAEYSPYYSSGVRATWAAAENVTVRVDLVNGWQNISETNEQKSVGTRVDWRVREKLTLSHYLYVGAEAGMGLRLFNGIGIGTTLSTGTVLQFNADMGSQEPAGGGDAATWNGGSLQVCHPLSDRAALALRGEWYADPDQAIIVPLGGAPEFRATGFSAGLDLTVRPGVQWRTEARALNASEDVFADRGAASGFSAGNFILVTALTMRF